MDRCLTCRIPLEDADATHCDVCWTMIEALAQTPYFPRLVREEKARRLEAEPQDL